MNFGAIRKASAVAVLVAAFFSGYVTVRPVDAVVNEITVKIHGGPESGSPNITCGWHGECTSPPTGGNALDWSNSGGWKVFFQSYAYYNGSPAPSNAGSFKAKQDNGVCKKVTVDVFRYNGTALGPIFYSHSDVYSTFRWTMWVAPFPESTWWPDALTSRQIATTASSELTGTCVNRPNPFPPPQYLQPLWTGAHLHQNAGSPWATNWGRFPNAPNTQNGFDVMSISNYAYYVTYQY